MFSLFLFCLFFSFLGVVMWETQLKTVDRTFVLHLKWTDFFITYRSMLMKGCNLSRVVHLYSYSINSTQSNCSSFQETTNAHFLAKGFPEQLELQVPWRVICVIADDLFYTLDSPEQPRAACVPSVMGDCWCCWQYHSVPSFRWFGGDGKYT